MPKAGERAKAIAKGQDWYYTGKPCKNGHIDLRRTLTGACYGCLRDVVIRERERFNAARDRSHGR